MIGYPVWGKGTPHTLEAQPASATDWCHCIGILSTQRVQVPKLIVMWAQTSYYTGTLGSAYSLFGIFPK